MISASKLKELETKGKIKLDAQGNITHQMCNFHNEFHTIDKFPPRKGVPTGRRGTCKEISNQKTREWRDENIDTQRTKERAKHNKWRKDNPEKAQAKDKRRYQNSREYQLERAKKYREENPDKMKEWRKNNPDKTREYSKTKNRIWAKRYRNLITRHLRLTKQNKTEASKDILGYTPKEFREHLISTAKKDKYLIDNMYDGTKVHIDHIIPLSKFKYNTPPKVINALPNLKLMRAEKNLSKGTKITKEIIQRVSKDVPEILEWIKKQYRSIKEKKQHIQSNKLNNINILKYS